jgi:hypothetical protein
MYLKETFYEKTSDEYSEENAFRFLNKRFKIKEARLKELSEGAILTVEEYGKLKRCPAWQVPDEIIKQEKHAMLAMLNRQTSFTGEQYEMFWDHVKHNQDKIQGKSGVLKNPCKKIVPFIRLRADSY